MIVGAGIDAGFSVDPAVLMGGTLLLVGAIATTTSCPTVTPASTRVTRCG